MENASNKMDQSKVLMYRFALKTALKLVYQRGAREIVYKDVDYWNDLESATEKVVNEYMDWIDNNQDIIPHAAAAGPIRDIIESECEKNEHSILRVWLGDLAHKYPYVRRKSA